jgi:hypothetical protein
LLQNQGKKLFGNKSAVDTVTPDWVLSKLDITKDTD